MCLCDGDAVDKWPFLCYHIPFNAMPHTSQPQGWTPTAVIREATYQRPRSQGLGQWRCISSQSGFRQKANEVGAESNRNAVNP